MGEMDDGANQPIQTNGGYDPTRAAMGTIASCVQLLIRERQNITFVFAGITTGVLDLLNNKSLTFLRRAKSKELASIPIDEVAGALRASIERSGLHIGEEALREGRRCRPPCYSDYGWMAAQHSELEHLEIFAVNGVGGSAGGEVGQLITRNLGKVVSVGRNELNDGLRVRSVDGNDVALHRDAQRYRTADHPCRARLHSGRGHRLRVARGASRRLARGAGRC